MNLIKKYLLRKYKNELRKYSSEEIKFIGKGRTVKIINIYESIANNIKTKEDLETRLGIKMRYAQDDEMKKREPNKIQKIYNVNPSEWVCYARSKYPHNNIDLFLKIGKLGADYLFKAHSAGPDFNSKYIGIPLKIKEKF